MNFVETPRPQLDELLIRGLGEEDTQTAAARLESLDLNTTAGLTQLLDHADGLTHHDPFLGERLTTLCDHSAGTEDLPGIQARARYFRAKILAERGELQTALDLVGQAHDLWSRAGDDLGALRTGVGRMQLLDDLGRHDDAVTLGHDLLTALHLLDPSTPDRRAAQELRAHVTQNLGVAYGFIGHQAEAMDAYASAEVQYRELGMHAETARPLACRGIELLALGRSREALRDLSEAHKILITSGDDLFAAQSVGELAQAHVQLGEFAQALRLLEQSRATLVDLGATVEAHRIRLKLAQTYLDAGLWAEARQAAQEVAEAAEVLGLPHDSAMARYVGALADLAQGRAHRAIKDLRDAERLFLEVNDRQHTARTQLARAKAHAVLGAIDTSRSVLDQCIPELRSGGWVIPLICAYLDQADLAGDDLDSVSRAMDTARPLVTQVDLPELTFQFHLRAGRLARRGGQSEQAEMHLRLAVELTDELSETLPDHVLRMAFRAERLTAHAELVDLLIARGRPGDVIEAVLVADAGKYRTLRDLLREGSPTTSIHPHTEDAELTSMSAELSAAYSAIEESDHPGARAELTRKASVLEHGVTALQVSRSSTAQRHDPAGAHTPGTPTRGAAHMPTIAFHVAGDDILVFVTVAHETTCRRLSGALPQTHALLDALADQWSRFALGLGLGLVHRDSLLGSTQATLGDLHALLIAPISDLIGPGPGALCVVPHGPMGAVPFHALFDGSRYLLQTWTVTVAPTHAAALATTAEPVDCTSSAVVAVADAYAPAVRTEGRLIADLLAGARLLVDEEATVSAVSETIADGVGLIHLACHGTHRHENPMFSRLRLGDRWLTSGDIVRQDLAGALVVLSACETGAHAKHAEPIGLGWAFLAAGASGVLVSLWEVHDEATCTLAAEFYRLLVQGVTPAEALRQAQLHTANQFPHPYYWAPFNFVTTPLIN